MQKAIRAARRRVVVIGDTMADRWISGRVAECQDGCPKFVQDGTAIETPGGADNAAASLMNWGTNVSLYGFADGDCPVKVRYVDRDGKIVFRADDDGPRDRGNYYARVRASAMEMCHHAGAVLLSDYDKGLLTPEFIRDVAELCRARGVPCVADCKRPPDAYAGCVLKCNADYQRAHNQRLAQLAYDDAAPQCLVVTYGPTNPIVWCDSYSTGLNCDLPPVKCVNHVGAGDCFAAHLALALAYGFSLKEAAALAHSAGRAYVQYPHNRPPYPSDVVADLASAVTEPAPS